MQLTGRVWGKRWGGKEEFLNRLAKAYGVHIVTARHTSLLYENIHFVASSNDPQKLHFFYSALMQTLGPPANA